MSTLADVYMKYEINEKIIEEPLRSYLGMSMIGGCHRYLQYYHYHCFDSSYTTRIQRLFTAGHDAEESMIDALRKADIKVTGQQRALVGSGGHWKGHIDGVGHSAAGTFLVEFKTHNANNFKKLGSQPLIKSFSKHYAQMQSYMGHGEFDMGLYVALNKNDSEIYLEWVPFDEEYFGEAQRKEVEVIASDTMLPRIGNNSRSWFECKMCEARDVCFGDINAKAGCRTCKNVEVLGKGMWRCSLDTKNYLSSSDQAKGCTKFELSDMFREN